MQYLTKDFLFMPEEWGIAAANNAKLIPAGRQPFANDDDSSSKAEMADIFLGMNEPDMTGSCMGAMMGKCPLTSIKTNEQ